VGYNVYYIVIFLKFILMKLRSLKLSFKYRIYNSFTYHKQ